MRVRTLAGLIELTRPINTLITGLTVIVGGIIAGKGSSIDPANIIGAAIAAALVAAGANSVNDAYDSVIDLINRPTRPIPSGDISRLEASFWGILLTILGVVAGWMISMPLGVVALAVGVLLWIYNSRLKRTAFFGNLTVALCGGLAFIYAGIAVGHVSESLVPAGFAFLIHLGREIVKDIEDLPGDLAVGARTLPIVAGRRATLLTAAGILALLALTTPIPYFSGIYGRYYFIVVSALTALPLLTISFLLMRNPEPKRLGLISFALKIVMLTGLTALYVG